MIFIPQLILATSLWLTSHLAQAYVVRIPQWALSAEETGTLIRQIHPHPLLPSARMNGKAENNEASSNDNSHKTNDELVVASEAENQLLSDLTNIIGQAGDDWTADSLAIYNAIADLHREVSTDASKINEVRTLALSTPMSAHGWQRLYTTCGSESGCQMIERLDRLHKVEVPRRIRTSLQVHATGICAGGPLMLRYSISTRKAAGLMGSWKETSIHGATGIAIGLVDSSIGDLTAVIEC
ncbi:hypothetical protein PV11_05499 [Exophiala sideris]|uniref:Uncharacterized protein n=1 Tax=Exophiala sideris TaxID=1016849 RepID=A0A0D1Z9R8_9EURO|nr:hypothetical protein PV11_05499 [Exophiala sideris]